MKAIEIIKNGLKHKKSNIVAILIFIMAMVLVWFEKATLTQVCLGLPVMFTFIMYPGRKKEEKK